VTVLAGSTKILVLEWVLGAMVQGRIVVHMLHGMVHNLVPRIVYPVHDVSMCVPYSRSMYIQ
jgi:hypothetical protein